MHCLTVKMEIEKVN